MRYRQAGPEEHVLDLSPAETNFFFEPFDINDHSMPSHLHHRGHRYIRQHIYDWLMENIATPEERQADHSTSWHHSGLGASLRIFMFKHKHHAMMFKLAWEGQCDG
jgi:hypothetical protein